MLTLFFSRLMSMTAVSRREFRVLANFQGFGLAVWLRALTLLCHDSAPLLVQLE